MIRAASHATLALLLLAGLSACGSTGSLKWPDGNPAPAMVGASEAPTVEQMLTPPPQAAPERLDDPVKESELREDDPFDLPPT